MDLIDRQAVIDAVEHVEWYHQNNKGEMVSGANSTEHQPWYKADDIYTALKALPSAQPEPAKCVKLSLAEYPDCVRRSDVIALATKGILISNGNYNSVCKAINYLESVKPERKTGKWIHFDDGSASYRCSICGKHQYGNYSEIFSGEFHFCPNCGARMES